jgi:predicted TIM-barrel fold metal-dependent hydrolase
MCNLHAHSHSPHHHRRQFLKKGFALFSGALAAARPSALEAKKTIPSSPNKVQRHATFDAHLHCPAESGELWQWHTVTRNFEEFVAYLDRTGVQRGIINSQRSQLKDTPAECIAGNREVARYVEKYKGRFLGACVVNPLFIDEALREIEECRKQFGFVWVGELCNYTVPYHYTIKEFDLLVRQVVEQSMVLDVHTELEEMEYIIQKFPQATIVFPHFGGRSRVRPHF